MKNSVARFDRGTVKVGSQLTPEGYIRGNAVVTRTGVFLYQNPDGTIRRELRHPEDVWNDESIQSMHLLPITNNHPAEKFVTSENYKRLSIGYTGEKISREDPYVMATVVITDKDAVEAVLQEGKRELSLGYTVDLEEVPGIYEGEEYDARQRNIKYNHLAVVDKARAGKEARIVLDSQDAVEILKEVVTMNQKKIRIDGKEIMVDESAADYIDRLERDLTNLEEEKKRVEEEIKMIADKLEKAEGERDSSKDKLKQAEEKVKETNMDSAYFRKAVSERIKLYKVAEAHLDSADLTNLDSMNDLDIKKLVIKSCRKSINLDGKGHAYLDAMFDTILDEQSSKGVNTENVKYTSDSNLDANEFSPSNARARMIEKMKNAHKGGK
jgi:uncharacterized protein